MITVVLGTRAQFIKMAPVLRELERRNINYKLIMTGQHQESMGELYDDFSIKTPIERLYEGDEIDSIAKMVFWSAKILAKLFADRKKLSADIRRDEHNIIVVHGDTASTLLGALLGKTLNVKVAHVESGLRSFDLLNPFPEELIRRLVFGLSKVAFCPNEWARNNLKKHKMKKIITQGNTIIDAVHYALKLKPHEHTEEHPYAVISIHRFENVYSKSRISNIVDLVEKAATLLKVLFVLHPATKQRLHKYGFLEKLERNNQIKLLPRMGYTKFINLAYRSRFVITDGGSNQEELGYLGVPVLLLRKATERIEGMGEGVILSRYDDDVINRFLEEHETIKRKHIKDDHVSPSKIIVEELMSYA